MGQKGMGSSFLSAEEKGKKFGFWQEVLHFWLNLVAESEGEEPAPGSICVIRILTMRWGGISFPETVKKQENHLAWSDCSGGELELAMAFRVLRGNRSVAPPGAW